MGTLIVGAITICEHCDREPGARSGRPSPEPVEIVEPGTFEHPPF